MPRRPRKPRELTDEQMLRRLFPKEARQEARKEARKARKKGQNKPSEGETT
jgi:hypothetical protein